MMRFLHSVTSSQLDIKLDDVIKTRAAYHRLQPAIKRHELKWNYPLRTVFEA